MSTQRLQRSRRGELRLPLEEVEQLVDKALDSLPESFAGALDNVYVRVEEEPASEDLEAVGLDPAQGSELFGLYQGIPLTERDLFYDALPDRVLVYAGPIRRGCATRREALAEIRKTLLHELGHHFGMEEDDMPF